MQRVTVKRNQYQDSVRLMSISREAGALPGVAKVLALLGTESNKLIVRNLGLADASVEQASANDLLVCVEAEGEAACEAALAKVDALLRQVAGGDAGAGQANPASIEEATERLPGANYALFSIPGPFAKLDVVAALERGLNVMLFSDNVSVEDEASLKQLAADKDLLLMGPDCGTSIINGVPFAFANVVRRGDIGVVGASGTGIQEITCLIDRLGGGISHAIGVGGRDLKKAIGGRMMRVAIRKLVADPATRRLVVVSKPGDPAVTREVLAQAAATGLDVIACILGSHAGLGGLPGVTVVGTLEKAALLAVGRDAAPPEGIDEVLARARALPKARRHLRGLYSGGTLCYETLLLAEGELDVHSNIAPRPELRLPYPARGAAHSCIDLGDDDFTQGRPHPMIDSTLRGDRIVEAVRDPSTKVLLLDVVLGYGANANPAGDVVAALARGREGAGDVGPIVIAHVCGTDADPQRLAAQEDLLRAAGVSLFPTNAEAARAALAAVA
jgi:FdrA protein